jgi:hypothetical protein
MCGYKGRAGSDGGWVGGEEMGAGRLELITVGAAWAVAGAVRPGERPTNAAEAVFPLQQPSL